MEELTERTAKRRAYFQKLQEFYEGKGYTVDSITPLHDGYFMRYRDKEFVYLHCYLRYGDQVFQNRQMEVLSDWEALDQSIRDMLDERTIQPVYEAIKQYQVRAGGL